MDNVEITSVYENQISPPEVVLLTERMQRLEVRVFNLGERAAFASEAIDRLTNVIETLVEKMASRK